MKYACNIDPAYVIVISVLTIMELLISFTQDGAQAIHVPMDEGVIPFMVRNQFYFPDLLSK